MSTTEKRCEFLFESGQQCQRIAGHDEPYYYYFDRGQTGYYDDTLSQGSGHIHSIFAPPLPVPPKEEQTGEERHDKVSSSAIFTSDDYPREIYHG